LNVIISGGRIDLIGSPDVKAYASNYVSLFGKMNRQDESDFTWVMSIAPRVIMIDVRKQEKI
jgi:hypothetical protein